jgi:hypothetical protein
VPLSFDFSLLEPVKRGDLAGSMRTAISGPAMPDGWNKPRGRSLYLDHA